MKRCLLVRTGYSAETQRTAAGKLARATIVGDRWTTATCILGTARRIEVKSLK